MHKIDVLSVYKIDSLPNIDYYNMKKAVLYEEIFRSLGYCINY